MSRRRSSGRSHAFVVRTTCSARTRPDLVVTSTPRRPPARRSLPRTSAASRRAVPRPAPARSRPRGCGHVALEVRERASHRGGQVEARQPLADLVARQLVDLEADLAPRRASMRRSSSHVSVSATRTPPTRWRSTSKPVSSEPGVEVGRVADDLRRRALRADGGQVFRTLARGLGRERTALELEDLAAEAGEMERGRGAERSGPTMTTSACAGRGSLMRAGTLRCRRRGRSAGRTLRGGASRRPDRTTRRRSRCRLEVRAKYGFERIAATAASAAPDLPQ